MWGSQSNFSALPLAEDPQILALHISAAVLAFLNPNNPHSR